MQKHFPNIVIGRGNNIHWSARSPDLTPLDYWFLAVLKSRVYYNKKPNTIDDLKRKIVYVYSEITEDENQNAVKVSFVVWIIYLMKMGEFRTSVAIK